MATLALNFSKVIELFSGQGHVKDFANHASFSTIHYQIYQGCHIKLQFYVLHGLLGNTQQHLGMQ